jgi:two-component sensor histidine kinase
VLKPELSPSWAESDRLAALRGYRILDTPPEPVFDNLVQLAAQVCQTPIALITLVEDRRQWFKAELGLGIRETPIEMSICARAILQPGLFVIPDATNDPRFSCNPLVTGGPHLRFYAGAVLETAQGLPLGTVCVLDHVSRSLTEEQSFTLKTLAAQVMSQLELRRALAERDEAPAVSRRTEQRQALLVRELHHRVRNTLATVLALVGATARFARTIREFNRAFSTRIAALAKTHTLLTEDYWQTVPLREMLLNELEPFRERQSERFKLEGPAVDLSADLAIPLSMVLHELTANAAQYGALSVRKGCVAVEWDVVTSEGKRRLHFTWIEQNGPPVEEPTHSGFGMTLLQTVFPTQCQAEVRLEFARAGLRVEMDAPWIERRHVPEYEGC